MSMGFEQIRLAIEYRLQEWIGAPVAFDNVATQPSVQDAIDAKEPWARCVIQHGDSLAAGIGSRPCVRRTGVLMLQVFTAEHIGSSQAAQLADSLAQHLEFYQDGPLETQAASVQRVGPSDGWFMYVVSCPFRAD